MVLGWGRPSFWRWLEFACFPEYGRTQRPVEMIACRQNDRLRSLPGSDHAAALMNGKRMPYSLIVQHGRQVDGVTGFCCHHSCRRRSLVKTTNAIRNFGCIYDTIARLQAAIGRYCEAYRHG